MDVPLNRLIEQLRAQFATMTDEQRLEAINRVADGYCRHCGCDESKMPIGCQCNNDE